MSGQFFDDDDSDDDSDDDDDLLPFGLMGGCLCSNCDHNHFLDSDSDDSDL